MAEIVAGPYFDDLSVGDRFDGAPAVTLTSGHAATHQAIVGDRLHLPLDATLSTDVVGGSPLAHPALVWDVAIGQSTLVTRHVKANLFYRGLVFRRAPLIGDTLRTRVEVVALRQNRPRDGRAATGLATLRVTTVDQYERPVLDFWRCAMLPLRDPDGWTGHAGPDPVYPAVTEADIAAAVAGWRLDRFAARVPGPRHTDLNAGDTWEIRGGDVVSSAPELARLTLNIAQVHHDAEAAGGTRLVYGGHTIGLAMAQATRALPTMVTVTGWHGCDHKAPVYEGDTVRSQLSVEQVRPLPSGGGLADLRSRVHVVGADGREVLDWRFVAVFA
jgi:acyl dehydratase